MKKHTHAQNKYLILKIIAGVLAPGIVIVAAYSLYVAVHEADTQETVLLGQRQIATGSPAAFRVLVRNRITGRPVRGAELKMSLTGKARGVIPLGTFRTDATGSFDGSVNIPEIVPGEYQLVIDVTSPLGRDHVVNTIEAQHSARLLFSSDKPIYQPGQTIHLRSLLINARSGKPLTNEAVTFEVNDANGNKVFKESRQSSRFGIASADFVLATELNPGRYQIRAVAGAAETESAVDVKYYVLPKFKIGVVTDRPYYLPGQTVSGTIEAHYFFGKPVAGAAIKLTAATFEEKPVTLAELAGQTDAAGKHRFQFVLPDFFVGLPQKDGHALLDITAEVSDTAQHSEQTTLSLAVGQNELDITALAEAGTFVPGVTNILYVLTAYPDGRPARCKVFVNGAGHPSDAQGACQIELAPSAADEAVEITALDRQGRKAKLVFQPDPAQLAPNLLIRSDQAVYQAGESANVTILSPEDDNTIFVDVIKDGQTVLTKSVPLKNHQARCSLGLPASLVGALQVNAYVIAANGEDRGGSRIFYVNPASGLQVAAKLSKAVYRPGELATVDFRVTDTQGHPMPAALGISAVDESVFALQENRPGLMRQFFEAEGDLLQPRYQIKFFDSPEEILMEGQTEPTLAGAYLASLGRKPTGSGLDELVKNGDPNAQSLIDHLRRFQGTPEYEALRDDPRYAESFQFLEGGGGLYSLREASGPMKVQAIEAHRRAYFKWFQNCFEMIFPLLLLSIPVGLLIFLCVRADKAGKPEDVLIWLGIALLVMVLTSMMLPALARAKQKAMRVSLINTLQDIEMEKQVAESENEPANSGAQSPPHVRRDFPETLLWRPELITDDEGKATLEIPLADSITTWRASIDGISAAGKMGSAELPIPVFQDFFVDLDLPVSMSLGDEISVPVACYNYLNEAQNIELTLAAADWFESPVRETAVHLGPNEVKNINLPIKVTRVGDRSLRLTARGTKMADAVEREIRVLPVGDEVEHTRNGVLQSDFEDSVTIPGESIPDSQRVVAKFYPSRFSEIVEGLDSIFQAPSGCFEQTSSTTYPNVLALEYLQRMGRLTPEIEVRARKYINAGYQRLLTFEVPGGGFEWFGCVPAHVGLTAYGVLEFTDMRRLQSVDQAMLDRTVKWLLGQQNADGSWNQADGLDEWAQRKPLTAYVAWSLAEAGDHSPNLDKALDHLRAHPEEIATLYGKALAANAFLAHDGNDPFGRQLATELHDHAVSDGEHTAHWTSPGYGLTYSRGEGLEVETTALSALALMKAGLWPETVKEALTWISKAKEANGTWGSTQATILAMRALLAGSTASLGQEFASVVTVLVNGQPVETFRLNKENSDVMKEIDLTKCLRAGENRIEFRQNPAGELPFQLAGSYWMASSPHLASSVAARKSSALQIDVQYDRATLAVNEQLNCAVVVKNNSGQTVPMAIVDLGIPPGFDVDPSAFDKMRERNQIAKFEATGTQVILYLRELSESAPFQFDYALRAKYPVRAQTPPSAVYEYYQPRNRAETKPVTLEAMAGR